MSGNYLAWSIKFDDFFQQSFGRDRLKFLVQFAVLAPSSHNCQPWKFEVGKNHIILKPDFKRQLAVSDPENRHLYIALGCALENLLIAANYYGLETIVQYLVSDPKDIKIKVDFKPLTNPPHPTQHLIFSIPGRRSNRNMYSSRVPDEKFLESLEQLATENVQISLVKDHREKDNIADILMESRLRAFSNKPFREEMANYKRTNFTSSPFGMPGFTLGINNLLSLFAPFLIRNFNVMKVIRKNEEDILKKYTSVFIFLNAKEHSPYSWISTGQLLQKILLKAEQCGVQASISAVPLNVEPIKKILKTSYRPEMFLRLGYATAIPGHSPRLQAEEAIEK